MTKQNTDEIIRRLEELEAQNRRYKAEIEALTAGKVDRFDLHLRRHGVHPEALGDAKALLKQRLIENTDGSFELTFGKQGWLRSEDLGKIIARFAANHKWFFDAERAPAETPTEDAPTTIPRPMYNDGRPVPISEMSLEELVSIAEAKGEPEPPATDWGEIGAPAEPDPELDLQSLKELNEELERREETRRELGELQKQSLRMAEPPKTAWGRK